MGYQEYTGSALSTHSFVKSPKLSPPKTEIQMRPIAVAYFYTGNKFYSSIFPVWARGVYSETLSKRWTTSRRSGTKRWCIVTALKRALFITWCVLLQSNIHRYSPTVTGYGAITPCMMILAEWQAHRTKTGAGGNRTCYIRVGGYDR